MTAALTVPSKKTALITGASAGIGRDFAHEFASHGYDVVLVARSVDKLEALAKEITAKHSVKAIALGADLEKPTGVAELVKSLGERGLVIDALVNNAGFGLLGEFSKQPLERNLAMIALNITALTELTGRLVPGMVKRGYGEVLNVASTASFQPGPLMSVYYATKAYVLSFSEAIANELAGQGVKVTALCPGPTQTEFAKAADLHGTRLFEGGNVMTSAKVAQIGFEALQRGKRVVIPGALNKMMAASVRFSPRNLVTAVTRRMQERSN